MSRCVDRETWATDAASLDFPAMEGAKATLPVRLSGRCLSAGSSESRCLLVAVSGRVGHVTADGLRLTEGARIVLYFELIGRIEGNVAEATDGEFDVLMVAPPAKWSRLVRQFETLAWMSEEAIRDLRGFRRIISETPVTTLTGVGGVVSSCRIGDISRSGAAVLVAETFEIGDLVRLGSTRARVVRHIQGGVAVQFLRLLPLESFGPTYAL